jgi:hypothetical protein
LFSYLLSAELPVFRKNDGKIGDIKGKVEKTGKNSWIFGNYLTIFIVHAIISNCADYIPRNFPCVSGGCPRVDRACFPGKGDWRETVRQSDPGWTGPAGISGL